MHFLTDKIGSQHRDTAADLRLSTQTLKFCIIYAKVSSLVCVHLYIQLNFNGLNTFGTMKVSSRQG